MPDDDDATAAAAAKAAEDRRLAEEAEAARRAEKARLRAAAMDAHESAHEALWAQATAVINGRTLIPVVLDQAANYTKWRGLFLTVLGKYALTRHVLEDASFPTRPVWAQTDYVVLTWIYSTVSNDLQQSLMLQQSSAHHVWC